MADKSYIDVFGADFAADYERLTRVRKPIIAAVAGFALGGGCELAMMCDLIIAADNAKFGQPEIKLGVIPGMGGTQRLTRAVGKAKAMDLILTGRMMDAAEAERSGLVARVVPAANLMDEAMKVAETIAAMSLPSVLAAKEAVNRAFETSLAEGVRFERRVFHALFAHRRPEGRHGRLRREAAAEVREQVTASGGHLRTQITRTTEALAASRPPRPAAAIASLLAVEERADRRHRHDDRLRLRTCRAHIGHDRRLEFHHADDASLRVERGAAGETELRRRLQHLAREPCGRSSRSRRRRPGSAGRRCRPA